MSRLPEVLYESAVAMRHAESVIAGLIAVIDEASIEKLDTEKLDVARGSMRKLLSYADKLEGVGIGLREGAESADAEFHRTVRSMSGR